MADALMAVTRHQRMSLPSASIIDPVIVPFQVAGGRWRAICHLSSVIDAVIYSALYSALHSALNAVLNSVLCSVSSYPLTANR